MAQQFPPQPTPFGYGGKHPTTRKTHKGRKGEAVHGPEHHRPDRLKSMKQDMMAHPSHHQANADHGTPFGFAPPEGYQDGGCDHHLGDNIAEED